MSVISTSRNSNYASDKFFCCWREGKVGFFFWIVEKFQSLCAMLIYQADKNKFIRKLFAGACDSVILF